MTNQRLRTARRQLGWTQREMAAALGVTVRTLSRWECGGARVHATAARFIAHLVGEHAPAPQRVKRGGHRR